MCEKAKEILMEESNVQVWILFNFVVLLICFLGRLCVQTAAYYPNTSMNILYVISHVINESFTLNLLFCWKYVQLEFLKQL